jgi:polyphosphate kinase 2 (PPK2 family)
MIDSKVLTIFEGPDGSGKTTAAREYAEQTGARYVHFPALPRVKHGLGRMYVEAMLPALLGYHDVVFDRCWLSETPYGEAFREGQDRLTQADRRMLERLALRCGAVVVKCLPEWDPAERY